MISFVLMLALAGGAWLVSSGLRRAADRLARVRGELDGTAFDASLVRSRICALRKDYVGELQSRERDFAYQCGLMESARHTLAKLAFFQRRSEMQSPQEEHNHAAL